MKKQFTIKSILSLAVLVCWISAASAQNDLDIKNGTTCNVPVKFKFDDGSGTCNVSYYGGVAASMAFTSIPTGMPTGQPFHVAVVDPATGNAVSVGDCSLTSCSCSGLPATAAINICGINYTVYFYPPGVITANAFIYIY